MHRYTRYMILILFLITLIVIYSPVEEYQEDDVHVIYSGVWWENDMARSVVAKGMALNWYIPFNYDNREAARSAGKKTALFFTQDTCELCQLLETDIALHKDTIPEKYIVFQVDVQDDHGLAKEYGVMKEHTVLYTDREGEVQKVVRGMRRLDQVIAMFRQVAP